MVGNSGEAPLLLHNSGGTLAAVYGLSHGRWSPSLIKNGSTLIGTDFTLQAGQSYLVYSALGGSATETGTTPPSAPPWSPT